MPCPACTCTPLRLRFSHSCRLAPSELSEVCMAARAQQLYYADPHKSLLTKACLQEPAGARPLCTDGLYFQ